MGLMDRRVVKSAFEPEQLWVHKPRPFWLTTLAPIFRLAARSR
jgi:hypothetical protein